MVLARVADEARVELVGLAKDGWEVLNQRFWQATAPEKDEGERPGSRQSAMVEDAGATMAAGFYALHGGKMSHRC